MTRDNKGNNDTSVFRGRSMQEAIGQLKLELGPDAVIVGTTRGSDRQGRYVEITATRPEQPSAPTSRSSNPLVSAAYANTAKTTSPLAGVGAAFDGDGPFAGRAKWLAEQVAARTGINQTPTASQPVDELMALRDGPIPRTSTPEPSRPARYVDVDPVSSEPVDT
ncbi:MAG: hypothetical protein ACPGQS_15380, partial [Bradymonadia bacterium]